MTFSPNIQQLHEQRSFKSRGKKHLKHLKLNFGNGALIFLQEGRFELIYFRILRRFFKKLLPKSIKDTVFYKRKG